MLLLSGFSCAHLALAVSLQDYANGRPLTVYTVKSGSKVPCGPDDQTNNFKEFDKVLLLSGKGLTSLDGISKLPVTVDGQVTASSRRQAPATLPQ